MKYLFIIGGLLAVALISFFVYTSYSEKKKVEETKKLNAQKVKDLMAGKLVVTCSTNPTTYGGKKLKQ